MPRPTIRPHRQFYLCLNQRVTQIHLRTMNGLEVRVIRGKGDMNEVPLKEDLKSLEFIGVWGVDVFDCYAIVVHGCKKEVLGIKVTFLDWNLKYMQYARKRWMRQATKIARKRRAG